MQSILSKVNLKVGTVFAMAAFLVLAGGVFLAPRILSVGRADVCEGATGDVNFNHFPITYTGEPCKDFPTVTLRNQNGQYPTDQNQFSQGVTAQAGDVVYVRVWVHNGAVSGGETAHNVNINVNVPQDSSGNYPISASISADNDHGRGASGSQTIHTNPGETLEIVPGSTQLFDDQGNPMNAPANFQSGSSSFHLDDQEACFEFARFIRFAVKVVPAATPQTSGSISATSGSQFCSEGVYHGNFQWQTSNVTNVLVTVRDEDTGVQNTISQGQASGTGTADWLTPSHRYKFSLSGDNFTAPDFFLDVPALNCAQPTQPVTCTPGNQAMQAGQTASFAAGGGDGNFSWTSTSGQTGSGSTFSAAFNQSGSATVRDGSGQSAVCNVTVNQPAPGPSNFTLNASNFCLGDNPQYSITGTADLVGKDIIWSSTLNGTPTGENNAYVGQTIADSKGLATWSGVGGTWQTSRLGNWTKTATINGVSKTASFTVKDCNPTTPPPTLICAPQNITVNPNQSVTFTAQGGTSGYTWTSSTGQTGSGNTFSVAFSQNGTTTVRSADGQTAACTVTVNQPTPAPSNFTLNAASFCLGDNPQYSITGSGDLVGQNIYWSSTFNGAPTGENNAYIGQVISANGGLSTWSGVGGTWQTSHLGNWTKTATIKGISKTVSFTVKDCNPTPPPTYTNIICAPKNQNIQLGQTAYFSASNGNGTFNWSASNISVKNANGNSFSVQPSAAGTYSVSVSDGKSSDTCNVTVNAPQIPTLVCAPNNLTLDAGQPITFTAIGGTGTYSWTATNNQTGNGNSFAATFTQSGYQNAMVTSGTQTAVCNVTVRQNQPQPKNFTVLANNFCVGQNATYQITGTANLANLPINVISTGPQGNESNGSVGTTSLNNGLATFFTTGRVWTNADIGHWSRTFTIDSIAQTASFDVRDCNPTPPPTYINIICAPKNQNIQLGQTAYFSATGGNGTFNWSASNISVKNANGNSFSVQPSAAGTYSATVSDGRSTDTCNVTVTAQPPVYNPVICSPKNQSIQTGQTVYFTASQGNGNYTWSGQNVSQSSGGSSSAAYNNAGTYSVTVSDGRSSDTCNVVVTAPQVQPLVCNPTQTQTVSLQQIVYFTASGGKGTYAWSSPNAVTQSGNGNSFFTSYNNSGDYNVAVSDGSSNAVCRVHVNQINYPVLQCLPQNQTANANQTVYFSALGGNGQYAWTSDGTQQNTSGYSFTSQFSSAGNHTVTVRSGDGQSANCNVNIITQAPPQLICSPVSQTAFAGQQVWFTAYGGNGQISWTANGANQTSGSGNSFNVSYPSAGSYSVVFRSNDGQTANCNVTVNPVAQQNGFLTINKWVAHINQNDYASVITANSGDRVSYKITVTAQSNTVNNVVLNDMLPSGVTYVQNTLKVDGGSVPQGDVASLNLGSLSAGQSRTVWFDAYVTAPQGQQQTQLTNTAIAYGQNAGQVSANATVSIFQGQVQGSTIQLTYSKKAWNDTKNVDAQSVYASKEDFITYTLTVTNSGNAPANNFVITDDMSQVMPFADLADNGGGTVSGSALSFPAVTVPAGGSVSKSFRVRVKYFLADNLSYTMTNTYGNTVTININTPQVKGAFIAPKTGADTMALAFGGFAMLGYSLFKKRKELLQLVLN